MTIVFGEFDVAFQGRTDADSSAVLAGLFRRDPVWREKAEQWIAGTFDGEHYAQLTLALHELHYTDPSDLLGTGLLTKLYRLAKVEADALDAQLLSMAEAELQRQVDEAAEARSETAGWARGWAA